MKNAPTLYTLAGLTAALNSGTLSNNGIDAAWVVARPTGLASIRHRIRFAWMVFTGRADAFVWPQGQ